MKILNKLETFFYFLGGVILEGWLFILAVIAVVSFVMFVKTDAERSQQEAKTFCESLPRKETIYSIAYNENHYNLLVEGDDKEISKRSIGITDYYREDNIQILKDLSSGEESYIEYSAIFKESKCILNIKIHVSDPKVINNFTG